MTDKLAPELRFLIKNYRGGESELASVELSEWVGLSKTEGQPDTVEVLVCCKDANKIEELRRQDISIHFVVSGEPYAIASSRVTIDRLEKLADMDSVIRVEPSLLP